MDTHYSTPWHIAQGDYRACLAHVQADLIFTSPPYNIGSKQARQDGMRKHGRYDSKSFGAIRDYPDSLPEKEYQEQQVRFFLWSAVHLTENGVLVYNHKPRRKEHALVHPAIWFLRPKVRKVLTLMEEIVWDRGSTHNHCNGLMWPQTERLYVFRLSKGHYPLRNTHELPYRADLWRIARSPANGHNAPFPLTLARAVVLAWSHPGALVCDPHTGSGTTGVAACGLGRRFVGAEALENYYRLALANVASAAKEEVAS